MAKTAKKKKIVSLLSSEIIEGGGRTAIPPSFFLSRMFNAGQVYKKINRTSFVPPVPLPHSIFDFRAACSEARLV